MELTKQQIKELLEKAYNTDTSIEDAEKIFKKIYAKKGEKNNG